MKTSIFTWVWMLIIWLPLFDFVEAIIVERPPAANIWMRASDLLCACILFIKRQQLGLDLIIFADINRQMSARVEVWIIFSCADGWICSTTLQEDDVWIRSTIVAG